MKTAKIFRHGNSQAVRLPKEFRFDATEVVIEKAGDVVLLIPKRHSATNLKEVLDGFKGQIDRAQPVYERYRIRTVLLARPCPPLPRPRTASRP